MTLITADTPGWIYILCFDRPIGNAANARALARHYLGFAIDVPSRVAVHAAGRGQALTQAVVKAGIGWQVFYRSGTPALERYLKAHYKQTPCLCPRCAAAKGRRNRYGFQPLDQAAMVLPPADLEEFPEPPPRSMDWLEMQITRGWRAALTPAPTDLSAIDDLL